jgi:nucleoredoxin
MDFIKKVVNKEGTESSPDFSGKIVGLYFSAHWCPPCRGFTPKLSEKFTLLKEEGKQFEIVFVSSDEDEESARNYFNEMSWNMMIPFDDQETKDLLDSKYEVSGIPTLVLINGDTGATMTTDGRSTLFEVEFDSLSNYAEEKAKRVSLIISDQRITCCSVPSR